MRQPTVTHVPAGCRRVELVVILGLLTAFAPLSIDMYLPAFPTLTTALETDGTTVQLSLASFFIAFAAGQVLFGPLSDRFGRRAPLFGSLLLYAVASIGCALAQSIEALIVLRLLQGFGACAGGVISRAVVRDLFERDEAARIFSALILVMGAAPIFAPLLGGKLLIWADWRAIFWFLSGVGLVCLAAVIWRMPETQKVEHIQSLQPGRIVRTYVRLLCDVRFVAYALIGALSLGGLFAYVAGSPFVFIDLFGLAPDDYAVLFGLSALGFVTAAQFNGRLIPRFGPARLLSAGTTVYVLGSAVLVLVTTTGWGGVPGFVVPVVVAISALGLMLPNTSAMALAHFPQVAGSASALLGCLQFTFAAIATVLMGAIQAESAVPVASMIAGGAVLAAAVRWGVAKE